MLVKLAATPKTKVITKILEKQVPKITDLAEAEKSLYW